MFGHIAGDRALSAVSKILRSQFRPRDLLVRYGGDEFAVLLPGTSKTKALAVGERVRVAVGGGIEEAEVLARPRGADEVVYGQATDCMSRIIHCAAVIAKQQIGMVAFGNRDPRNSIRESQ